LEIKISNHWESIGCARIAYSGLAVPFYLTAHRAFRYPGVFCYLADPIFEAFEHLDFIPLQRGKLWHNLKFGDPKLARLSLLLPLISAPAAVAFET
jgi:hypothetical protein